MAWSRSDIGDQQHKGCPGSVHRGQIERRLSRMFGSPAHGGQQQSPAGDGFHPGFGLGRSAVPTPPVVNQRYNASAALATFDVLGRKAAPVG
jgi:hypothetical protein